MTAFAKSCVIVGAITVGMLAAVACGKPKAATEQTSTSATVSAVASCDTIEAGGSCTDYASSTGSFGVERSLCRSAGGAFRSSMCPTRGRIGSCVLAADREVKRYYEHAFTAERAQADCADNRGADGDCRFLATR